jgi:pyruvate/2-oxoglutarate/acetoin dehydrogenase E1 component
MATLTMVQAVNDALKVAMRRDKGVLVFGEDVGPKGGVFLATEGLTKEFGKERCFDTPLSEDGIVGAAIGMALNGLKPVAEIQFQDFIFPAFDQIVSEAAKFRYRSGGQYTVPMVIRTPYGGGIRGGLYHSQSGEAYFCHTPGLKVVIPSTPEDAKGLLLASIEDPDPVLFMEPKALYRTTKARRARGLLHDAAVDAAHRAHGQGRHRVLLRRDGAGVHEGRRAGRGEGHRVPRRRPAHAAAARRRGRARGGEADRPRRRSCTRRRASAASAARSAR